MVRVLAILLLFGCDAAQTVVDASYRDVEEHGDVGMEDAGQADGDVSPLDASTDGGLQLDGGESDVGTDSAVRDGGPGDGGSDAAAIDAGPMDAGIPCAVGDRMGVCLPVFMCSGVSTPGFCPGPADIQCCTETGGDCDPGVMPTPNAGLVELPVDVGCPAGMVDLGSFCIDRFEASLVLVDGAGTAIGSWSPFHNPGANRVAAVSLGGAIPQGYINGRQAADACEAAGKRLCTNTEWLSACRGAADRIYPYGNTRRPGICNDARATHPAVERFGTSADWIWSELDDACINQIPDSVARTGAHPDCATPEGVIDLMGNLHEWTSDASGTFRGGFYADTRINGEGCLYRTTAHSTGHFDYSTGFRCCAEAE